MNDHLKKSLRVFVDEFTILLAAFCLVLITSAMATLLKPTQFGGMFLTFLGFTLLSFLFSWLFIKFAVKLLSKLSILEFAHKTPTWLFVIPSGTYIFCCLLDNISLFLPILLTGIIPATIFQIIAGMILSMWKNRDEPIALSVINKHDSFLE